MEICHSRQIDLSRRFPFLSLICHHFHAARPQCPNSFEGKWHIHCRSLLVIVFHIFFIFNKRAEMASGLSGVGDNHRMMHFTAAVLRCTWTKMLEMDPEDVQVQVI